LSSADYGTGEGTCRKNISCASDSISFPTDAISHAHDIFFLHVWVPYYRLEVRLSHAISYGHGEFSKTRLKIYILLKSRDLIYKYVALLMFISSCLIKCRI